MKQYNDIEILIFSKSMQERRYRPISFRWKSIYIKYILVENVPDSAALLTPLLSAYTATVYIWPGCKPDIA